MTGAATEPANEPASESPGDAGAAVVEFVLVSVLLLGLFLSVLQVGFALYVRNTLVACAADGADGRRGHLPGNRFRMAADG